MSEKAGIRWDQYWYHGWNVIALVMLLQVLTFGLFLYSFSFWIDSWASEFNKSRSEILWVATIYNLIYGFSGPFVGRALDTLSSRILSCFGLFALIVGLLVISQADSFLTVIAVYALLMPIAASFAGPYAAQAFAVRWFPERTGLALGFTATGTALGGVLMPIVVIQLIDHGGWRFAHQMLSLVVFAVVPICWSILSKLPPSYTPAKKPLLSDVESESIFKVLKEPVFWLMVMIFTPMYFLVIGFQYNIAPFAAELGKAPAEAAFMTSMMAICMVVGKLCFGWLIDKIAHYAVCILAVVGLSVSLFLLINLPANVTVVSIALLGFFSGSVYPLKGAMVASYFGANRYGSVVGMMAPLLMSSSLAPVFIGWHQGQSQSYYFGFLCLAIAVLPGIMFSLLLSKKSPKLSMVAG